MFKRHIIILLIFLCIPFVFGAVKPNFPSCLVLSNTGTSIDANCDGVIDQSNNTLLLNGLSSSSFALQSTLLNINSTLNDRINAINSSSSSFSGMINITQVNATNTPSVSQTLIYNGTLDKFTWVTPSGATYTAQAPWLYLSGTTFNFNRTQGNNEFNDTLYCDAGLSLKANTSQLASYTLLSTTTLINSTLNDRINAINSSSSSGNFTAYNATHSWSSNGLNISGSTFTNVGGVSQLVIIATGGGGNPFNQNLNKTDDVTFNNMNLSGTLLFPNNIGTQTLNSTGGTCGGQHYYGTDNCWHTTTCTGEDIVC